MSDLRRPPRRIVNRGSSVNGSPNANTIAGATIGGPWTGAPSAARRRAKVACVQLAVNNLNSVTRALASVDAAAPPVERKQ